MDAMAPTSTRERGEAKTGRLPARRVIEIPVRLSQRRRGLGLMLGLGETDDEVEAVMRDLRLHVVDMLTVGQYLQPRAGNLPVRRYVTPDGFTRLEQLARAMGFAHVACGP